MTANRARLAKITIGHEGIERIFITRMLSRVEFDTWEREYKIQRMTGKMFNLQMERSGLIEKYKGDLAQNSYLVNLAKQIEDCENWMYDDVEYNGKKYPRMALANARLLSISTIETEKEAVIRWEEARMKDVETWMAEDMRIFDKLNDMCQKFITQVGLQEKQMTEDILEWCVSLDPKKMYTHTEIIKGLEGVIMPYTNGEVDRKKSEGAYGVKMESVYPAN